MLYLLYAESLHYCGYGEHYVIEANSETDAIIKASDFIEDYFREQDYDQFLEENGVEAADSETYSTVLNVEVFDEMHDSWQFKAKFTHL